MNEVLDIDIRYKPVNFEFVNGSYVITKRIGNESVRVALEPDEAIEFAEFVTVNGQPWGDAS